MQAERRSEEQIRLEIATERQQLVDALGDLRGGIAATRKPAVIVLAALAALLAVAVVARVIRLLSR